MSRHELAGFSIAFQSEHEVVLVKPAGVASEVTRDPGALSVIARLRAAAARGDGFLAPPEGVWLPHRLDRPTRGYLLVALTEAAIRFHNEAVRSRAWAKYYLARVAVGAEQLGAGQHGAERLGAEQHGAEQHGAEQHGADRLGAGQLLGEHKAYLRRRGTRMDVVRSGGLPSFLTIHATAPAPGRPGDGHVIIELRTGRYHQIRAMLANLGTPLVGDPLYGGPDGPFYLEHAAFVFSPYGADTPLRLFAADDPEREPVDPGLVADLARIITPC